MKISKLSSDISVSRLCSANVDVNPYMPAERYPLTMQGGGEDSVESYKAHQQITRTYNYEQV